MATGVRAPISALQPGDLVGTTGHIAIYAGNGMMWESPRTGAMFNTFLFAVICSALS